MRKDEFMRACDWVAGIDAADSDRDKPEIQSDTYEIPFVCERRRHGRRGYLWKEENAVSDDRRHGQL